MFTHITSAIILFYTLLRILLVFYDLHGGKNKHVKIKGKSDAYLEMGFWLKSATWSDRRNLMFSGMSQISFRERSSSTRLMRLAISGGMLPISFSERVNRRKRTRRNKFYKDERKQIRWQGNWSNTRLTFGRSRKWLASSKSSSSERVCRNISSGIWVKPLWLLSTYSTCRLQPLKGRGMHLNISKSRYLKRQDMRF